MAPSNRLTANTVAEGSPASARWPATVQANGRRPTDSDFSCIFLQKIRNVVSVRVDIVSEAAPGADGFDAVGPKEKLEVGRKSRRNPLKSHKTRKKTADHLGRDGGD
jgi:hypothetical protein